MSATRPVLRRSASSWRMALCALAAGVPLLLGAATADPVASVAALVDAGEFKTASSRIDEALGAANFTAQQRSALDFERERMRRIALDFSLTESEALARVRRQAPDVTETEFRAWDAAGLLEGMRIDGEKRYFNRAPSNLFRLSSEAAARRKDPKPFVEGPMETANAHHREVRDAAVANGRHSVAPRRVQVTHSITVDADAVPAGETVRAWLPVPRAIAGQQEGIAFLASTPAKHVVAPEATLQRTAYLEQPAVAGQPTRFSITYEVTVFGQYHRIDPAKVTPALPTAAIAAHTGERPPHIVFTDDIREFSRAVVGEERHPYRIAQKLFAAVDRIPWAGAREYSTIRNISDYALKAGHADCGQQTLLLMTLLRLNGIPARWQSGWVYSDGEYDNMHDWGWLYLAPYGWVPMDVTTGRLESGDPEIDGFYLGGLDAYRIAFNDDYGRPFVPAKRHFRSETVDSQRGEVEWAGGNLYFDRWDYDFKARVISATSTHRREGA